MNETIPPPPTVSRVTRSVRFFNYLYRYKNLFRQYWWVPPLTTLLALGVQFYLWRTVPQQYVSFGRMIVNVRLQTQTAAMYLEELGNFLGTQVALMQSGTVRSRAAERVRALKPTIHPVPVELKVSVVPKTAIFNLQARGTDREYVQAYLDACMEEYQQLKRDMKASTAETSLMGITEELRRLEKELHKGEEELLLFQSTNSVVLLQEQGGSVSSYLVALNRRLAELKTEYELLKMLDLEQNLELQASRGGTVAGASDNRDAAEQSFKPLGTAADYLKIKQEIQMRKAEQKELAQYLRPKHPRMIALAEEITRQENLLEIFRQLTFDQLESRRTSLALQIQNLEREVAEWNAKALEVSRAMAEYTRLRIHNERLKGLYDRLLTTMQALGVGREIDPESVTIFERASEAMLDRPTLVKALLLAGGIGLLLGIGWLMLVDRFDDRINSLTELQDAFDEEVLGQIPLEEHVEHAGKFQLIQPDDHRHAFAESYRTVRSSLFFMAEEGKPPKTLLITSAAPSEGKSITATHLATVMALAGARVLLIDADLRKGQLHRHFGVAAAPGLCEALTSHREWAALVVSTPVPNLFLLPCGSYSKNPGELFLQEKIRQLLQAAAWYDCVLLDSAPVMAADDVTSLAPHTEGVIFVLRAGQTSARVARAALELLYQRNVEVRGLIFNGAGDYNLYKYKEYYAPRPTA